MQRAKLFGALFAYVNNIQITWKTIHLSVFCRTNSPSIDQSRTEGNNTECVGKKRFNGRVLPTGFGKENYLTFDWWKHFLKILRRSEVTINLTRRLKKMGASEFAPCSIIQFVFCFFFRTHLAPVCAYWGFPKVNFQNK